MDTSLQQQQASSRGDGFFSREALSGIPWMIAGKLLLFFVYFGISVITVNGLGREQFGVYSLMSNLSSYLLILCGLGLGAALTRYIPELATHKNYRGLVHLLWKSAALQLAAVAFTTGVLLYFSSPLQRLLNAEHVEYFHYYLLLVCLLVGLLLFKDFVATVYTALFRVRMVTALSLSQGVLWISMLAIWMKFRPEVVSVFYVQMASLALVYAAGIGYLVALIRRLEWRTLPYGIGRRRTLKYSGTVMISAVLRTAMFKYSEIFFLAFTGGTTVVGMYDLGYTLPYTLITFIPLALLSLFTAAFSEAYVRDNHCLSRLIPSYYKILIMVSIPPAMIGAFFAPDAYHILYQGRMDQAGYLASAFCLVLLFPLISLPLSMALKAKEKVHSMLPMLLLQIVVNITLDWLLIVELGWGIWGGVAAVAGTFVLTIVPRLMVAHRVIGGIYFPFHFFCRMTTVLALEAGLLYGVSRWLGLFTRFESEWANIALLFATGGIFLGGFILLVRKLRLVKPEDLADFKALEIERLNRVFAKVFGL